MKLFAKHANERRVGCLEVIAETIFLFFSQTKLTRLGEEQLLIEPVELSFYSRMV